MPQAGTGNFVANVAGGHIVTNSGVGAAGEQVQAALDASATEVNHLTYAIVSANAVAALVSGVVLIAGVVGGPLSFEFVETVSAGGWFEFKPPHAIPATDVNIPITVTLPAISNGGAGAVVVVGWRTRS